MTLETPRLDQLLTDPLIRMMMKSDGVVDADLRALARSFASRRQAGVLAPTAAPLSRRACSNQLPI